MRWFCVLAATLTCASSLADTLLRLDRFDGSSSDPSMYGYATTASGFAAGGGWSVDTSNHRLRITIAPAGSWTASATTTVHVAAPRALSVEFTFTTSSGVEGGTFAVMSSIDQGAGWDAASSGTIEAGPVGEPHWESLTLPVPIGWTGDVLLRVVLSGDAQAAGAIDFESITFVDGYAPIPWAWGPFSAPIEGAPSWRVRAFDADGDPVSLMDLPSSPAVLVRSQSPGPTPGETIGFVGLAFGIDHPGCVRFAVRIASGLLRSTWPAVASVGGAACSQPVAADERRFRWLGTDTFGSFVPVPADGAARSIAQRPKGDSPRPPQPADPHAPVAISISSPPNHSMVYPGPFRIDGAVSPPDGLGEVVIQGQPFAVATDGRFSGWAVASGSGPMAVLVAATDALGRAIAGRVGVTVEAGPEPAPATEPCVARGAGAVLDLAPCGAQRASFSSPVDGWLEGTPDLIVAYVRRLDGQSGSVDVSFEGLTPNRMYRVLDGRYDRAVDLPSDASGRVQTVLALAGQAHPYWIQSAPGTVMLDGEPGCGDLGGTWEPATPNPGGTCHLPQQAGHAVQVVASNVTLDCHGTGSLIGLGSGVGLVVDGMDDVVIRGCRIGVFGLGVLATGTHGFTFEAGTVENVTKGIRIARSSGASVSGTTLSPPLVGGPHAGVAVVDSTNVTLSSIEVDDYATGIQIARSDHVIITDATATHASNAAILLTESTYSTVTRSVLTSSSIGLSVTGRGSSCTGVAASKLIVEPPSESTASIVAVQVSSCPGFHLGADAGIGNDLVGGVLLIQSPDAVIESTRVTSHVSPLHDAPGLVGVGVLEHCQGARVGPDVHVEESYSIGVLSASSDVTITDVFVDGPTGFAPSPLPGPNGALPSPHASVGVLLAGTPHTVVVFGLPVTMPQSNNRIIDTTIRHEGVGIEIAGAHFTNIEGTTVELNSLVGVRAHGIAFYDGTLLGLTNVAGARHTHLDGRTRVLHNGNGVVTDQWSRETLVAGTEVRQNDHINLFLGGVDEQVHSASIRGFSQAQANDDCLILGYVPGDFAEQPSIDWISTRAEVSEDTLVFGCGRGLSLFGAQASRIHGNRIASNLSGVTLLSSATPVRAYLGDYGKKQAVPYYDTLSQTLRPCGNEIRDNDVDMSFADEKFGRLHGLGVTVVDAPSTYYLNWSGASVGVRHDRIDNPLFHNSLTDCCFNGTTPCSGQMLCAPLPPPTPPQVLPIQPVSACAVPYAETGAETGFLPSALSLRTACINHHGFQPFYEDLALDPLQYLFDTRVTLDGLAPNPTFRHGNYWGHTSCDPTGTGVTWFGPHPYQCGATVGDVCTSEPALPLADTTGNNVADCHPYSAEDGWLPSLPPPDQTPGGPQCPSIYTDACFGEAQNTSYPSWHAPDFPIPGEILVSYPGGSASRVMWDWAGDGGAYQDMYQLCEDVPAPPAPATTECSFAALTFKNEAGETPDVLFIDDPLPARRRITGASVRQNPDIDSGKPRGVFAYLGPWHQWGEILSAGLRLDFGLPELAWAESLHTLFVLQKKNNRLHRFGGLCLNPEDGLTKEEGIVLDPAWTVIDLAWDETRGVLYALVDLVMFMNNDYRLVRIDPTSGDAVLVVGGPEPDPSVDSRFFDNQDHPQAMLIQSTGRILVSDQTLNGIDLVEWYDLNPTGTSVVAHGVFAKGFHMIGKGLEEQRVTMGPAIDPKLLQGRILVVDREAANPAEYRIYALPEQPLPGFDAMSDVEAHDAMAPYVVVSTPTPIDKLTATR